MILEPLGMNDQAVAVEVHFVEAGLGAVGDVEDVAGG